MSFAPWRNMNVARGNVLVLAVLAGCGRSGGVPRLPVYGTVAHADGEKMDGSISFLPDQGRPGPGAVTSIVKGEYRFDKTNGPVAGPHRVIVTRMGGKTLLPKQAGNSQGPPTDPKGAARGPQTTEWKLSADIPAKGPYQFDFKLP